MSYENTEQLKERLSKISTKTIGIYGWMLGTEQTYFDDESSLKRQMGNVLLRRLENSENIGALYKIMKSIDELTIHGMKELDRQYLFIPKFLYVGTNELTEKEYEIYIRLLTMYGFDQKKNKLSKTKLSWFQSVCFEVYKKRIMNQKVYNEHYLEIIWSIEKNENLKSYKKVR